MLLYIKKRDGQKALFNPTKIRQAISKAFLAVQKSVADDVLDRLGNLVVENIESKYSSASFPSVEHTQDIVELVLMREGHMEAAKAYILYRAKHEAIRDIAKMSAIKDHQVTIIRSNGEEVPFSSEIVLTRLQRLSKDLPKVDLAELIEGIVRNIYNHMPLTEVEDVIVGAAKQHIEKHYDYSFLASRLVIDKLYKDILDAEIGSDLLDVSHSEQFRSYIDKGVELELLDPELARFDLERLGKALHTERDQLFKFLGTQTIVDRYLLRERDAARTVFELPQFMWMRVAMGLALAEKEGEREDWAIKFYDQLSQLNVVSSTPTLFNSGTMHAQMSSCYLNTVTDSMEGIFKNFSDDAQLSKWAGGIGTSWTSVRAKGATIKGTNGRSQGIVPFLKIYNDVALAVNQGGKRKGAMAAYLDIWHADVEEFFELKKNTGDERRRCHDIHTAVFISDLFMKRVREKKTWTLFSPEQTPDLVDAYGLRFEEIYEHYESQNLSSAIEIPALDIWRKLLTMLFETGHPWITFKDPINLRSPQDHVGVVHNSNLCTEITLNTSEDETAVCNLASINMARMVKDGELDLELIRSTTSVAMRMLDNVVDCNFYPIPEARNANMRHRPVGLGMMGYQDALYQLGIDFDSEENLDFADYSMEVISHASIHASSLLAKERGAYQSFKGSKWDRDILPVDTIAILEKERGVAIPVSKESKLDWTEVRQSIKSFGMRNSNCMAIAPTATISNIAGTVPCIEPAFKNLYMKENLSGNFLLVNSFLIDALEEENLWNEEILTAIKINNGSVLGIDKIPAVLRHRFKETFEIEPKWILQAAARRGKWIDQSASTNVFLKTTSGRVLSETYMMAWELGLKTTYYLRTLAASQVTKTIEAVATAPESTPLNPVVSPSSPMGAPVTQGVDASQFKACSITDPDCEACQ